MKPHLLIAALAAALVSSGSFVAGSAHGQSAAQPETLARVVTLPEVVVSTARAGTGTPVAKSILDRDELQRRNWGQDTPMALATLPGAYAYSDAGNGIGYSYLAIRGFPQRRVSVLINGVPLNDPESHEVYWIDHPDLLASTAQVQLQRGVGSALYGAASVGGSVNLETAPFGETRRTSAAVAYGSFDTRRVMLEMDSGRLAGGWSLYGRYSRIETDGYRDQSWSKLWSYALSARKLSGTHSFRLNLYGGPEQTHLAYLGVSSDYLSGLVSGDRDRDRRFNPITYPGEADHFFEPHYELIHSWSPRPSLALTHTLFYFDGDGYYDEQRFGRSLAEFRLGPWATFDPTLFGADSLAYYADANNDGVLDRDSQGRVTVVNTDVVRRRWVGNRHFGWIPRARIEHRGGTLTAGGELRFHDGRHIGTLLSGRGLPPGTEPDHVFYDYHPRTLSAGLFVREEWRLADRLRLTGDLAWRHQAYFMRGDLADALFHPTAIRFDQRYDFAIPRAGLTWTPRPELTAFAAWSLSRREPAFRDLYDAEGAGSVPLYRGALAGVYDDPLIRPERVRDYELGASWQRADLAFTANLFRMDFRDELVYAGQFNTDLGYPILGNAARSVHQGVEMEGRVMLGGARRVDERSQAPDVGRDRRPSLELSANATLSDNHFVHYREIYGTSPGDTVSYDGKAIGFFPAVMANVMATLGWRGATLGVETQTAGRLYLDNTEDAAGGIAPRTVLNLSGGYRLSRPEGPTVELSVRLFNALDKRYETGGYSYLYAGTRYTDFIPAATRSALTQVRVEF
jgi:iron complex outermembrane recepter protein